MMQKQNLFPYSSYGFNKRMTYTVAIYKQKQNLFPYSSYGFNKRMTYTVAVYKPVTLSVGNVYHLAKSPANTFLR